MFKDYHFNKWTKDKEGEFFKIIGRFDCNFTKEISLVRKTRMKTKRFNEQPYTYANNKASTIDGVYHALEDADNYAGQPDAEMFDAYRYNDDYKFPIFRRVAEWFELNKKKDLYDYTLPEPKVLLNALEKGLPSSAGVALGVERLLNTLSRKDLFYIK